MGSTSAPHILIKPIPELCGPLPYLSHSISFYTKDESTGSLDYCQNVTLKCDAGYLFSDGYDSLTVMCDTQWTIPEEESCEGKSISLVMRATIWNMLCCFAITRYTFVLMEANLRNGVQMFLENT